MPNKLSYLTAREVGARLGVTASLVRRRAKDRNVGLLVTERTRVFTDADVELLRPRPVGTPGHSCGPFTTWKAFIAREAVAWEPGCGHPLGVHSDGCLVAGCKCERPG